MPGLSYAQVADATTALAILASGQNPDGTKFALPVESAPPSASATHATATAAASTWTTVVSMTPTVDRALLSAMADLTAVLGTRYQLRLTIAGVTQFRETIHTDYVSVVALYGLRAPAGAVVLLQALHTEATAQDVSGTLVHRAA